MKLVASLLLVVGCVSHTWCLIDEPVVAGLRKSSLEIELKSLKKLFEAALKQMKNVNTAVENLCPACQDECADDCLTKMLRRFEERLQRLHEVICKLEKLASQKCPKAFWTAEPQITPDGPITNTRRAALSPAIAFANAAGANAAGANIVGANIAGANIAGANAAGANIAGANAAGVLPSVVVATNGHIYRDSPSFQVDVGKTLLAISYDRVSNSLYTVEEADDESVTIVRRDVDGSFRAVVRTYTAGHVPADLTFDNSGVMYVLLTEETTTYFEQIENITTSPVVTKMGASLGHGRRLSIDSPNRLIYFTSSAGVSVFDISANTHTDISDTNYAYGIGYDAADNKAVYCFSNSGDLVVYNPTTQTSSTTSHGGSGCSDLAVSSSFPGAQIAGVSNVFVYITANDQNQVFVSQLDGDTSVPQMTNVFDTGSTITSITLV